MRHNAKRIMTNHNKQFKTLVVVTVVLAAALLLLPNLRTTSSSSRVVTGRSSSPSSSSSSSSSSRGPQHSSSRAAVPATSLVKLAPTYEVVNGTEVVWQKPTGSSSSSRLPDESAPRGVLLVFHGCSHAATDWFPQGPTCQTCIGLPEEVLISSTALSRGYALLAISSRDRRGSRCWAIPQQPEQPSADTRAVVSVLSQLLPREGLLGLPLFALGASSGGAFVLTLPAFVPLAGVCCQIMALPPNLYRHFLEAPAAATDRLAAAIDTASSSSSSSSSGRQPPVLFVPMERDESTAAAVAADVAVREQLGLVSRVLEVKPQPVTAEFLSARVTQLAQGDTAAQLVQLLVREGLLDAASLQLLADPRRSDWRTLVKHSSIPGASAWELSADVSALSEVLNVAWAQHEITSDTTADMLDWFEQQQQQQQQQQLVGTKHP